MGYYTPPPYKVRHKDGTWELIKPEPIKFEVNAFKRLECSSQGIFRKKRKNK